MNECLYVGALFLLCICSDKVFSLWQVQHNKNYIYPTLYYFTQRLDHFNPTINKTFQQRYFVNKEYWIQGKGPIFFYTGNEGDVTSFINNTGFVWDIAPIFNALVIFAEHRYYGLSKPNKVIFPSKNTTMEFAQLTAEQALADFAELITYIKKFHSAENSAVIAFGGSYGGMLSAWMRIKYGHLVDGAIAASAPLKSFSISSNCDDFNKVVTQDFLSTQHGSQCVKNIRNGWSLINQTAQHVDGLQLLTKRFRLCNELKSADELINWIIECWGDMAMVNYPYPANFLTPLPAWPVNKTCEQLSDPLEGAELLEGLFNAISIYANYTGDVTCFDTQVTQTSGISDLLWGYQSCSEMVMSNCATGVDDMFPVSKWDFESFAQSCQEQYGVSPRLNWIEVNFGADNLKSTSNIVFSNGLLDPWHLGGILNNVSDSVVSIVMWAAAHHLDLRHYNPNDPLSVKQGRETEMLHITKWIADKYNRLNSNH